MEGLSCTHYAQVLPNTVNMRADVSGSKYSCVCVQEFILGLAVAF